LIPLDNHLSSFIFDFFKLFGMNLDCIIDSITKLQKVSLLSFNEDSKNAIAAQIKEPSAVLKVFTKSDQTNQNNPVRKFKKLGP
jgi:replication initiation and membrane attachment protein DnaB